jgi:flagellar hook protein FlgE
MSFQTGLSGLNASARNLDVIGHNIANANTTGMKSSRSEFSGLVSSALGSATAGGSGIGVELANVAQLFTQGNISTTGNNLDVAINGSGFFQLTQTDGSPAYTRDGSFKLDTEGHIITNTRANLMGYPTDEAGKATSATIEKLKLPTSAPIAARATTAITAEFNLDSGAPVATSVTPNTPRTTYGTALNVYDSQGSAVPISLYFVKVASTPGVVASPTTTFEPALDNWDVFNVSTGGSPLFQMRFDANGALYAPATSPTLAITTPSPTTPNISATLDISKVTQFGSDFAVSDLTQNGYTAGELTGLNIGENGVITANYSNGQTQSAGQLALADFRNIQGLAPLGGNAWASTQESGLPVQGSPGLGKFGILRAGALEESNVDLTAELVNMMTAQRAYQANAQTIKTQDQIMSTLVNLR